MDKSNRFFFLTLSFLLGRTRTIKKINKKTALVNININIYLYMTSSLN